METLSFTLGVLSVIIVAFVAVLVWGIVKVVKQEKQIKNMNDDFSRSINDVYRIISDSGNRVDHRFAESKSALSRLNEEVNRAIDERTRETLSTNKSYTDMKIDKLIDAYFEYKDINKKKQVIKG